MNFVLLPTQTCKVYCEFRMGEIDVVLRVGEKVVPNPDEPCSAYVCDVSMAYIQATQLELFTIANIQVNGDMRVEVETCAGTPEVCHDGKAPFRIPGDCCLGCSKFFSTSVIALF